MHPIISLGQGKAEKTEPRSPTDEAGAQIHELLVV